MLKFDGLAPQSIDFREQCIDASDVVGPGRRLESSAAPPAAEAAGLES
ncbi:hypothetical protein AB0H36_31830 [Kribbella sp. NPDC050820]